MPPSRQWGRKTLIESPLSHEGLSTVLEDDGKGTDSQRVVLSQGEEELKTVGMR